MTTYEEILANIAAAVPELTSPSQIALFTKIAQAIAISVDNTKTELDNTKSIIENIIGLQRYGRSGYYTDAAKAFQYGDSLVINPDTLDYEYAVIDETKKIVKQAAFEAAISGGAQILTLKIAKLNETTGLLEPLTLAEKTAFDGYFLNFEIPGLPMTKVTSIADEFSFNAILSYYATYDYNSIIVAVEAALIAFRDDYEFDGVLYPNDLEVYVKTVVPGVRNFSLSDTLINSVPFTGSQRLTAGYFNYITNIENNITYVAV